MLSDRHSTAEAPHPVPAADLRGPPPPRPEKTRTQVGPPRRGRRRPRGAPRGAAGRLRRRGAVNLPRDGVRGTSPARATTSAPSPRGRRQPHQGARQGASLKVMSKMGVSTVASLPVPRSSSASALEQVARRQVLHRHHLQAGRRRLDVIADGGGARPRHGVPAGPASPRAPRARDRRRVPVAPRGRAAPLRPGDGVPPPARHRTGRYDIFKQYTSRVDEQSERLMTLRGLFPPQDAADLGRPVSIDEVEPVSRSSSGSRPAPCRSRLHLARGARDPRHRDEPAGREVQHREGGGPRAALRPRAAQRDQAGRVRPLRRHREYLTNADDIQIKMAQGAKPGEGGQLPGNKVYPCGSRRPGTRRRAWASSARRRTTTSTRSRISRS